MEMDEMRRRVVERWGMGGVRVVRVAYRSRLYYFVSDGNARTTFYDTYLGALRAWFLGERLPVGGLPGPERADEV